ncbi:carboxymuconolactone decarboxylase family protein [Williamsia sp.]|uniref:carboxymuconolactone decarboxylase family protein n=1 Tax=Williamsia sp. TaxID=1872085 RepID=UPI002F95217C
MTSEKASPNGELPPTSELRQKGLDTMAKVYGFEMQDGPGDFFAYLTEHLFADVWNREGLTIRDRRLILFGVLAASGQSDVAEIQAGAALANNELTGDELLEIALFLCYYVGWPQGSRFNMMFGSVIAKHEAKLAKQNKTT